MNYKGQYLTSRAVVVDHFQFSVKQYLCTLAPSLNFSLLQSTPTEKDETSVCFAQSTTLFRGAASLVILPFEVLVPHPNLLVGTQPLSCKLSMTLSRVDVYIYTHTYAHFIHQTEPNPMGKTRKEYKDCISHLYLSLSVILIIQLSDVLFYTHWLVRMTRIFTLFSFLNSLLSNGSQLSHLPDTD